MASKLITQKQSKIYQIEEQKPNVAYAILLPLHSSDVSRYPCLSVKSKEVAEDSRAIATNPENSLMW
ncbi:hypothetical protein Ocin01_09129 [Orchesella cincta]|uniref:Uncharacterized protein n=1 Tax=Orchesella cincta TaxID=48709 RepID=A0A1D2MWY3_ORCCI|nr:hypothetical protein Ocin01_09129 [Orchesella cincta]